MTSRLVPAGFAITMSATSRATSRRASAALAVVGLLSFSKGLLVSLLASHQLFDIAEISVPAGGAFVSQQVLLADERHLDVPVSSTDHIGTCVLERHAIDAIEEIDSYRLDADRQHRIGLTECLDRHCGRLEAEVNQCRLEPSEVIAGIAKENVDVLR